MLDSLVIYLNSKGFTNYTRMDDGLGINLTAEKDGKRIGFAINTTDDPITSSYISSIYDDKNNYRCSAIVLATTCTLNEAAAKLAKDLKIMVWNKQHLDKIGVVCDSSPKTQKLNVSKPMKALVCEMCGSNDIIKKDGFYVCQSCGTKYTTEEAQKLMIDVNVKIDRTSELQGLYASAKEAETSGNDATAQKLYETLLQKDPTNWEPVFFTTYYEASNCVVANMTSAMASVNNCLSSTIPKIYNSTRDEVLQEESLLRVTTKVLNLCLRMYDTAISIQRSSDSISGYGAELQQCVNRIMPAAQTAFNLGDWIAQYWGDNKKFHTYISTCYWGGINGLNRVVKSSTDQRVKSLMTTYTEKLPRYDPSCQNDPNYKIAVSNAKSGCFIATAVYGSYNCPQVWTLRRFRDLRLKRTWYGRAFISVYYSISPYLVRYLGKTRVFNLFWKSRLDRFVNKLNKSGFESTPYIDK